MTGIDSRVSWLLCAQDENLKNGYNRTSPTTRNTQSWVEKLRGISSVMIKPFPALDVWNMDIGSIE